MAVGDTTPMDRQQTCLDWTKSGHLFGVPCGKTHRVVVHVFDLRRRVLRCLGWPRCTVRLNKPPRTLRGLHHTVIGDYVVIREEK